MEDKKLERLESKVQASFDNLNSKLDSYNQKLNEVIPIVSEINNINKQNNKGLKININFKNPKLIIPAFVGVFFIICLILYKTSPKFICNTILNEKTHFNEQKLSVFKLILYSSTISAIIVFCVIFTIFIINMKK
jgi:hypothetical protein